MKSIWYSLYNIFILPLLSLIFKIGGLFNAKIKIGLSDRKKLFEQLIINCADLNRAKKKVWIHSASMGEFEQAKPIIRRLRKEKNVDIIITFFSPSGYRNSLKYPYADIISYLPLDTPFNMSRFVNIIKPNLVLLMRYDIWPNLIWYLGQKKIPAMIVDATMRSKSKRKLPIALQFHKTVYRNFTKILTVSENDSINFASFNLKKNRIEAVGDTRFDRVYEKSLEAKNKKLFAEDFFKGKKIFVMGSSWEADEDVMLPAVLKLFKYDPSVVLILVPHEPTVINIEKIEHSLLGNEKSIRFSLLNQYKEEKIIIIDSIGILLTLYYYADAAYVGGSFKQGIHNVLEPAVYGIPVIYGPKIENSREARTLAEDKGGIVVRNKKEAYRILRTLFRDDEGRKLLGEKAFNYVHSNIGATQKILKEVYKII